MLKIRKSITDKLEIATDLHNVHKRHMRSEDYQTSCLCFRVSVTSTHLVVPNKLLFFFLKIKN
jgi:hypothetical protein